MSIHTSVSFCSTGRTVSPWRYWSGARAKHRLALRRAGLFVWIYPRDKLSAVVRITSCALSYLPVSEKIFAWKSCSHNFDFTWTQSTFWTAQLTTLQKHLFVNNLHHSEFRSWQKRNMYIIFTRREFRISDFRIRTRLHLQTGHATTGWQTRRKSVLCDKVKMMSRIHGRVARLQHPPS